jgi:hypothetical protein
MTIDTSPRIERTLGTFVPGALLVLGTWYFHRPFLLQRFPSISAEDVGANTKAIVFLVLAISAGILISHMADTAVAVVVRDASATTKSDRPMRHVGRAIARIFSFTAADDARVNAIGRYLRSPRGHLFLRMAQSWSGTSQESLSDNRERIFVHQHIVAHLKAKSEQSRQVIEEIYHEVHFAAAFFTAWALLLPVAILALWTSHLANDEFASFSTGTYLWLIAIVWACGALTAYSLKRQFRNFCSEVLTLALHFYAKEGSDTFEGTSTVPSESLLGPKPQIAG